VITVLYGLSLLTADLDVVEVAPPGNRHRRLLMRQYAGKENSAFYTSKSPLREFNQEV
jgi:hypothetical protein